MNNYGSLWSLLAAREMGYFEEQGITLNLISFDTGPNIIAAMEGGSRRHRLHRRRRAQPLRCGQTPASSPSATSPTATPSSADRMFRASLTSPARPWPTSTGTTSYNILVQALATEGLTMDDINGMDMDPSSMVSAMLSGNVDACAI